MLLKLAFTIFLLPAFFCAASAQSSQPAFESLRAFPKVRDLAMTSDGNEAYFTVQTHLEEVSKIAVMKKKNGKWGAPELVPFSSQFDDLEPSLSPDGLKLLFVSTRPLDPSSSKPKDHDIWFVTRGSREAIWSEPKNLGAPVNSAKLEFYPSVASNGNIYFTREDTDVKPDIMFSRWNGSTYGTPEALSEAVNTDGHEYNAFIAPDESFLIFGAYQRQDGSGSGDLYISERDANGDWSTARNLGKGINSAAMDYCPFVDLKTKTLYFTSRRSSVDGGPVRSMRDFLREANKYENGFSRIYRISFADELNRIAARP